jgi:hypothetical protein
MAILPHPTDHDNHFLIIGIKTRNFFHMLDATGKIYDYMRN